MQRGTIFISNKTHPGLQKGFTVPWGARVPNRWLCCRERRSGQVPPGPGGMEGWRGMEGGMEGSRRAAAEQSGRCSSTRWQNSTADGISHSVSSYCPAHNHSKLFVFRECFSCSCVGWQHAAHISVWSPRVTHLTLLLLLLLAPELPARTQSSVSRGTRLFGKGFTGGTSSQVSVAP